MAEALGLIEVFKTESRYVVRTECMMMRVTDGLAVYVITFVDVLSLAAAAEEARIESIML